MPLAFLRWPVNSPHKWPVTRKMFPFDDVIMYKISGKWVESVKYIPWNMCTYHALLCFAVGCYWSIVHIPFNTMGPRQNGCHFTYDLFKCILFNENALILTKMSLNFVIKGPIKNIPALVQIMAWRRPGAKPLSEIMMVSLPRHIGVTRPQWVKDLTSLEPVQSHDCRITSETTLNNMSKLSFLPQYKGPLDPSWPIPRSLMTYMAPWIVRVLTDTVFIQFTRNIPVSGPLRLNIHPKDRQILHIPNVLFKHEYKTPCQ